MESVLNQSRPTTAPTKDKKPPTNRIGIRTAIPANIGRIPTTKLTTAIVIE